MEVKIRIKRFKIILENQILYKNNETFQNQINGFRIHENFQKEGKSQDFSYECHSENQGQTAHPDQEYLLWSRHHEELLEVDVEIKTRLHQRIHFQNSPHWKNQSTSILLENEETSLQTHCEETVRISQGTEEVERILSASQVVQKQRVPGSIPLSDETESQPQKYLD